MEARMKFRQEWWLPRAAEIRYSEPIAWT